MAGASYVRARTARPSAAIATLSDSGPSGRMRDPGACVDGRRELRRQALALGADADHDRRLDARPRASGASARPSSASLVRSSSARSARAGGRAKTSPCSPAPPSGSRVGAARPEDDRARRTSACAARTIVPTLPGRRPRGGTRTAAPPGPRPALAVDADHPGPGAQRADRVEQLGLDVLAGDQDQLGLGPRRPAAAATRSSPSATNRPLRSRSRWERSLRISFSFSLWGLVISLCFAAACWRTKRAARFCGPPGRV